MPRKPQEKSPATPQKSFAIDLEKEELIFSAAHFITFGENICEAIHGHNYRVRCRVSGPLGPHAYVVDFIALRDGLKKITHRLDHHVLLPDSHPDIHVAASGDTVSVKFGEKNWLFPTSDCIVLPVENTTAERLAEYIGDQLLAAWPELGQSITSLTVGVDENEGQWGECHWNF